MTNVYAQFVDDAPEENIYAQFVDEPQDAKKEAGLGQRILTTGKALGQLAYDTPTNIAGYAANLEQGSRPLDKTNWADKAAAAASQRLNERMSAPDANDPALPWMTKGEMAQTGASLPFSAGGMGAAIGAGGLATVATRSPKAGYAAGALAAGGLAYRADSSMFMNNALDGFTKKYQADNNGEMPSRDILLAEQERLQPFARDHGLVEAGFEGAGSLVGGEILKRAFKPGGNIIAKSGKAIAGLMAEEMPSETATQIAQNNIEIDAGVHDGDKRSFTSLNDLVQSAKEVAPAVVLQSALMGGSVAGARKAYDYGTRVPVTEDELLTYKQGRLDLLSTKRAGTPAQSSYDTNGNLVTVPGKDGEPLNRNELAEHDLLSNGSVKDIANNYNFNVLSPEQVIGKNLEKDIKNSQFAQGTNEAARNALDPTQYYGNQQPYMPVSIDAERKAKLDELKAKRQIELDATASTGALGSSLAAAGVANTDSSQAEAEVNNNITADTLNPHASKYDSHFQSAEDKYGLPTGLLSTIGFHESGFDSSAVSDAGARGLMQFMPATAKEYGINPHDPLASIDAAGKKISGLYHYYNGDMQKAVAAYNYGEGNLDKAIVRADKAGEHWTNAIPRETQNYLSKVLGEQPGQAQSMDSGNGDNQDQAGRDAQIEADLKAIDEGTYQQPELSTEQVNTEQSDLTTEQDQPDWLKRPEDTNAGQEQPDLFATDNRSLTELDATPAMSDGSVTATDQLAAANPLTQPENLNGSEETRTSETSKTNAEEERLLNTDAPVTGASTQAGEVNAVQNEPKQAPRPSNENLDKPFVPTHELSDGTQLQQHVNPETNDASFLDKEGGDWTGDESIAPIEGAKNETTQQQTKIPASSNLPNPQAQGTDKPVPDNVSVDEHVQGEDKPAFVTAPLLNKRDNRPFKTRKQAEMAIASPVYPEVNKQDSKVVEVGDGFGIAPIVQNGLADSAKEDVKQKNMGDIISHVFNSIQGGNHYVNAGSTANEKYITIDELEKYVDIANKQLTPENKITSSDLLTDGIVNGAYTGGIGSVEKMSSSSKYPGMVKGKVRNIRIKISPESNKQSTTQTTEATKAPYEIASDNTKAQLPAKLFDNPIKSLGNVSTRDFVASSVNEGTQFTETNGKFYIGNGKAGLGKQVPKAVHTYGKAYQAHLTAAYDVQSKAEAAPVSQASTAKSTLKVGDSVTKDGFKGIVEDVAFANHPEFGKRAKVRWEDGALSVLPISELSVNQPSTTQPTETVKTPQELGESSGNGQGNKQPWEMTRAELQANEDAISSQEPKAPRKKDSGNLAVQSAHLNARKEWVPKYRAAVKANDPIQHKAHIEKALSEGKPVPQEVLADYPELQKQGSAEHAVGDTWNAEHGQREITKIENGRAFITTNGKQDLLDVSPLDEVAQLKLTDEAAYRTKGSEAVHIEGEGIERVTPKVVDESLDKAADNTPLKTKTEMREWLIKKIDAAIGKEGDKKPATYSSDDDIERLKEERDGIMKSPRGNKEELRAHEIDREIAAIYSEQLRSADGQITFDVPGDGKFKVLNTKEHLAGFKKQVLASSGFREGKGHKAFTNTPSTNNSTQTVIDNFLKDDELDNAYYAAQEAGTPLGYGVGTRQDGSKFIFVHTGIEPVSLYGDRPMFVGKRYAPPIKGVQKAIWAVIDSNTGVRVSTSLGESSKEAAIKSARDLINNHKDAAQGFKDGDKRESNRNQEQLLEAFKEEYGINNNEQVNQDFGRDEKTVAPQGNFDAVKKEPVAKAEKTHLANHNDFIDKLDEGTVTAEALKAAFESVVANKDAIYAELNKLSKDEIVKQYGAGYLTSSDKKDRYISNAYKQMLMGYRLDSGMFSYGGGNESFVNTLRDSINKTNDADIEAHGKNITDAKAAYEESQAEKLAGMENPTTFNDYVRVINAKITEGKVTQQEAIMSLPIEQQEAFDKLWSDKTRNARNAKADQQKKQVNVAATTAEGEIVETKHTKTGADLFVVKAAERVDRDVYNHWNETAKRLGGYYSAFRGAGAVPGFQFKSMESAEAFLKFIGGDAVSATEAIQTRRDAFADDRSQSASERLNEMADTLEERADESMGRERKENTHRRARQAAAIESSNLRDKSMAETMRNIAEAISVGTANMLDRIRQKTQVEMLQGFVSSAQNIKINKLYVGQGDQSKHDNDKPDSDTASYAEFPEYTIWRSNLADMGRKLIETDGFKKLGAQILKEADDVSKAYLEWAKENILKVSTFSVGSEGRLATFASKANAETAISRAGFKGQAIVFAYKRGDNRIILSPSEAIKRGLWQGDDRIVTLSPSLGAELVEKIGKKNRRLASRDKINLAWQLENAYEKRKRLAAMGIETPAELRTALREFIALRAAPREISKIKEMERAMAGRANDGMDFFPTPAKIADEMIEAADIQDGMSVLEPSAGMGHIAERLRDAGHEADVVEMSNSRKELLEAKGFNVVGRDFMDLKPRDFFMWGDTFKAPDGKVGTMAMTVHGGLGSDRVVLKDDEGNQLGFYNRDDLVGVKKNGVDSGYDRIIMNPPFGDRRDAAHVQHAYDLLAPNGRLVAIMGEGVFFGKDKTATAFREWLEQMGGTDEKLPEGSFLDPSLPVNTGVNSRMVVIDKGTTTPTQSSAEASDALFSKSTPTTNPHTPNTLRAAITKALDSVFGAGWMARLEATGKFKVIGRDEASEIIGDSFLKYSKRTEPAPEKTITAYKLFRVKKSKPGQLFPLFVKMENDEPVPIGEWQDAEVGEQNDKGKVKSKLGPLAFRPGWHMGDAPASFHIGGKPGVGNKPTIRPADQVWAEVEVSADKDWQEEANRRATYSKSTGKMVPGTAHLTDRLPTNGFYRYKTNANMVGKWIIAGSMKITRILSDSEVSRINRELGGAQDLPREAGDNGVSGQFDIKYSKNGDIIAFYNPANDTTYFVHDNISQNASSKELLGLVTHEVGVHALQLGKTNEAFQALLKRFEAMQKGNPKVREAFARVPSDTKPEHRVEESLAHFLELYPESTLSQRIIEAFRQLVRAIGNTLVGKDKFLFSSWANKLTETELQNMAISALKTAPESLLFDNVGRENEAVKLAKGSKPLLAPNGKPSNLNAVQHAQVRTEAFKKWFGDWLYNPDMEMTPIELVDDPNMPIDGDAKTLSKYLREKYGTDKVENKQTGNEIGFYRDGIESSVKNRKLLSRRLYAILPQLLKESAYAGYEENTKLDKKPHVLGYETYYAAVSIGGKVYSVRIAVDRIKNDVRGRGYYYHQVEDVSLGDEVGSTRVLSDSTSQVSTPSSPNGKIILSQLTGKVNNDASKVVDENGEPLVVYHGTDGKFTNFNVSAKPVNRTGNPQGIYLTPIMDEAADYGSNVMQVFVNAKNPYIEGKSTANKNMLNNYAKILKHNYSNYGDSWIDDVIIPDFNKSGRFKDIDGAFKSDVMISGGYDSYNDGRHVIAFNPNQIKSATSNNGNFSSGNDDIRFSKKWQDEGQQYDIPENLSPTPAETPVTGNPFDNPKDVIKSLVGAEQRNLPHWDDVKSSLINGFDKMGGKERKAMLGFLSLRNLADLAETVNILPILNKSYVPTIQKMVAAQNRISTEAGKLSEAWLKLYISNRGANDNLVNLMGDSTTAGIDGSKKWVSKITPDHIQEILDGNPSAETKRLVKLDKKRKLKHAQLKRDYDALPPAFRGMYDQVRDTYQRWFDQRYEALQARILDEEGTSTSKAQRINTVRAVFESMQVDGPYFPLPRFGDYWVKSQDKDGNIYVTSDETLEQQTALKAEIRADGGTVLAEGVKPLELGAKGAVDADFVAKMDDMVKTLGSTEAINEVRDGMYQLYLSTLPSLSNRKHQIHRKNRLGWSKDMLRAFADIGLHEAKQYSKLKFGHKLQQIVSDIGSGISMAENPANRTKAEQKLVVLNAALDQSDSKGKDAIKAMIDRLEKRIGISKTARYHGDFEFARNIEGEVSQQFENMMNPQTSSAAVIVNSIGFGWYLGGSIMSGAVNTMQNMLTINAAAAEFESTQGLSALPMVAKEFAIAAKDFMTNRHDGQVDIAKGLKSIGERRAYVQFNQHELFDKTQGHDLSGTAQEGFKSGSFARYVTTKLGFFFHHAERFNRQVSAIAIYRAAIKTGLNHQAATDLAERLVWKTHYDYSAWNRARHLRSPTARITMQFKQYGLSTAFLLGESWYKSVWKDGNIAPAERRKARAFFGGVMASQLLLAGAQGLPAGMATGMLAASAMGARGVPFVKAMNIGMGLTATAALALAMGLGDDDDDQEQFIDDPETWIKQWLADHVGKTWEKIIMNGLVDALTPVGISNRVSMNGLLFRSPDKEMEGDAAWAAWSKTFMGPTMGGMTSDVFIGASQMNQGEVWKGLEHMVPSAVKGVSKAVRGQVNGITNMAGNQIVKDLSPIESALQLLGDTPSRISEQYDLNNAEKNREKRIGDRRKELLRDLNKAKASNDVESMGEIRAEIKHFNAENNENKISHKNEAQSFKNKHRIEKKSEGGLYLKKGREYDF